MPAKPFSSVPPSHAQDSSDSGATNSRRLPNPQDFVKVRLEPGEWDPDRKDPIHRPPWRNNAKIMHPDDFFLRSRSVLGNGEVASVHDTMSSLGWLSAKDQDTMYQSYLDMCQRMTASTNGITSHEYIFRVLGQKFNVSSSRVAAVCVLKHNEEQMKARGEIIYYEHQDYADEKIAGHIQSVYSIYNEVNPHQFVEDSLGNPSSEVTDESYTATNDLIDVDANLDEANVRAKEEARLVIDSWVYKEDIDEDTIHVSVSPAVKKLMAQHARWNAHDHAQRPGDLKPLPGGGAEPKRPRYKYAAHFVEAKTKTKKNQIVTKKKKKEIALKQTDNTIVELDGQLRVATVKEAKGCSWKPKRDGKSFMYQGLHDAWLERQLSGSMTVWGRQEAPAVVVPVVEAAAEGAEVNDDNDENEADDGTESFVEEDSAEKEGSPTTETDTEGVKDGNDGDDKKE